MALHERERVAALLSFFNFMLSFEANGCRHRIFVATPVAEVLEGKVQFGRVHFVCRNVQCTRYG